MRDSINLAVSETKFVLFMKGTPQSPQCGFSQTVLQILDLHNVDKSKFVAYDVLADTELRDAMKEYSQWPTFPQLYVGGEFIGGCDIVRKLAEENKLKNILENDPDA